MKQKTKIWVYPFVLMTILILFNTNCKKTDNKGNNNNNQTGTVTDIEGNIYRTVTIGTQVWMAENLKTTKFNDGSSIPLVPDSALWSNLSTAGYCWYNNDSSTYKNLYGALYNWYAVTTGKLCPTGWHVPNDAEWLTLISYLGGEFIAGGKMKETGTAHWNSPNTGATNESGFTALPGGYRLSYGWFFLKGSNATWWTTTTSDDSTALLRNIINSGVDVFNGRVDKKYGYSVRGIRD